MLLLLVGAGSTANGEAWAAAVCGGSFDDAGAAAAGAPKMLAAAAEPPPPPSPNASSKLANPLSWTGAAKPVDEFVGRAVVDVGGLAKGSFEPKSLKKLLPSLAAV